jgi:hypothetical protein
MKVRVDSGKKDEVLSVLSMLLERPFAEDEILASFKRTERGGYMFTADLGDDPEPSDDKNL